MSASCCDQAIDPHRGNESYRRVLWAVLAINALLDLRREHGPQPTLSRRRPGNSADDKDDIGGLGRLRL